MTVLCLTGWQQPADSLAAIAPEGAVHFDYTAYDDAGALFAALPKSPRLAIGWSLGGQLLVRAIAGGHTKPEALILLGAPFQWVADERFTAGMPADAVDGVKQNYRDDAQAMLKNLNALIALGDVQEKRITRALNATLSLWPCGMHWLEQLATTSCAGLDFEVFPPAIVIHGLQDNVIRYANAQAFAARLPQTELLLWPQCAHAPHLHDAAAVRDIVGEYA